MPAWIGSYLWQEVWQGRWPRAWDGTGHYAIAQIYDQSIFPDTFGWTHAYFGGMPFPNFYPPLFYWCVSLIHHTHLLSFASSFKLMTSLPVLLIPAAIWLLGWAASDKSRLVATGAALGGVALLADSRFISSFPAGLDYFSTFQIGLYTQPLGFVLMCAWYIFYLQAHRRRWQFALASLLLALTVLANFFNAATAALFILSTLVNDFLRLRRAAIASRRLEEGRALLAHLASPVVAASLTLFWVVPMLCEYQFFVTRPFALETGKLISPVMCGWYALAFVGGALWARRPTCATRPYLLTCLALAVIVLFATAIAPPWFPLQSPRFLATFNFLLAVPSGYALGAFFKALARVLGEGASKGKSLTFGQVRYTAGAVLLLLLLLVLTSPGPRWAYAFYSEEQSGEIDNVLSFAREHQDGLYLVEVINPQLNAAYTEASFDARAVNSYLGAQGNRTLSTVFHEASPNVIFDLPVTNAFSDYPDNFGISSLLADDLDFSAQSLEQHLKRARFLGVKYLVVRTPKMKERVARTQGIASRYEFGWWSVFELEVTPPTQEARVLPYLPALVVSDFTLKQRRRNELSFIRLVEEQFADNWFDVLLARSPEIKLDLLNDLNRFGALLITNYYYNDENLAFERLRAFARQHLLILLSSDSPLFKRLSALKADNPQIEIIERTAIEPGEPLEALGPTSHYMSHPIRQEWLAIRHALERSKVSTTSSPLQVTSRMDQRTIHLHLDETSLVEAVPIVIATTFHPNWQRDDNGQTYAATPFNMLIFAKQSMQLTYKRQWYERIGVWASASALLLLCLFVGWRRLRFPSRLSRKI